MVNDTIVMQRITKIVDLFGEYKNLRRDALPSLHKDFLAN